jgi:hypothetical protein
MKVFFLDLTPFLFLTDLDNAKTILPCLSNPITQQSQINKQKPAYSEKLIPQPMMGHESRNKLTDY